MAAAAGLRSSKRLAFLFVDLRGYTAYTAAYGDLAAARLAARFADITTAVVGPARGEVLGLWGDEALVAFETVLSAVEAAVLLQDAFERERGVGEQVNAGIGIDVGEAIAVMGSYRGRALNVAARLCSLAGAGEILVTTAASLELDGDGFDIADRGPVPLKGLPAPVGVCQVARRGSLPPGLPPLARVLVPGNLPHFVSSFVGRADDLAAVLELIGRPHTRLVTLTGPGGVGKTRLAVAAGFGAIPLFSDGVFFVDLSVLSDESLVIPAVLETLGVEPSVNETADAALRRYLASRRVLLVIDNFEHVLGSAAEMSPLLRAAPDVTILATSRVRLELTGEFEVRVPPLRLAEHGTAEGILASEAVTLLTARAAQLGVTVGVESAATAARLCRSVDALPLAIEIAAGRLRDIPLDELADQLEAALASLGSGPRDLPDRHRTLRATMEWTHAAMPEFQRVVLRRLGVFSGAFFPEDAAAVVGMPRSDVESCIEDLVRRSLLDDRDADGRLQMLRTVRDFALDELERAQEHSETARRHAEHFLALALEGERDILSARRESAMARFVGDRENVRAALAWSAENDEAPTGLRLIGALSFWYFRVAPTEVQQWVPRLLSLPSATRDDIARGWGLMALAAAAWGTAKMDRIADPAADAAGLARTAGDRRLLAWALSWQSLGTYDGTARQLLDEAVVLWQAEREPSGRALARMFGGFILGATGEVSTAHQWLDEAVAICRAESDTWLLAASLHVQGILAALSGDVDRAAERLAESAPLYEHCFDRKNGAVVALLAGLLALAREDLEHACRQFSRALEMSREIGDAGHQAAALHSIAGLAVVADAPSDAARLIGAGVGLRRRTGAEPFPGADTLLHPITEQVVSAVATDKLEVLEADGVAMREEESTRLAQSVLARFAESGPGPSAATPVDGTF